MIDNLPDIRDLYDIVSNVGKGSYGAVSKAKDRRTNETVALKLVQRDKLNNGFPENAIREIKILRALRKHPNIITLRDIITCGKSKDVYLIFDYCPFDLQGLIFKYGNKMGKQRIVCYFRQILLAIYFCHCHNVLHRDIKPSNIFVQVNNIIRMGDFGLARVFPPTNQKHTNKEHQPWNVVTIWYRPPELLLGAQEYGKEIDVWSLGCVLYEMITGEVLFKSSLINGQESPDGQLRVIVERCGQLDKENWPDVDKYQFYESIYLQKVHPNMKPITFSLKDFLEKNIPEEYSGAVDILAGMLELNPHKRLTIPDVFLNDFMASPDGSCDPNSIDPLRFDEIHAMTAGEKKEQQQPQMAQQQIKRPQFPNLR